MTTHELEAFEKGLSGREDKDDSDDDQDDDDYIEVDKEKIFIQNMVKECMDKDMWQDVLHSGKEGKEGKGKEKDYKDRKSSKSESNSKSKNQTYKE